MKITDSTIAMTSSSLLRKEEIREESLRFWIGDRRPDFSDERMPLLPEEPRDVVTISPEAFARQHETAALAAEDEVDDEAVSEDPYLRTIRLIVEAITGRKIKITEAEDLAAADHGTEDIPDPSTAAEGQPSRQGWGLEYDYHESRHELEEMNFSVDGSIRTADGREINFSLQLVMSREFSESTDISSRAGDARLVDPLVINFDGKAAELQDMKFSFDLDADGNEEQISFVGPGSGFLVLDHNKDQVVNNGSELFGPSTGKGFAELARYDADNNSWLDENDPIFAELKIWTKDEAGNDSLQSLQERKIGALFLGSSQSDFQLKDPANDLLGKVEKTGIFLKENGVVGTIQEIDLVI